MSEYDDNFVSTKSSKLARRLEKEYQRVQKRIRTKDEAKEDKFRHNYKKNKAAVYSQDAL